MGTPEKRFDQLCSQNAQDAVAESRRKEHMLIEDCVGGLLYLLEREGYFSSHPPASQQEIPNEHGKNRYGLDMSYFRNLISRELLRPLVDYKPSELARVFARAARTADSDVLHEQEFQPTNQHERERCEWHSDDSGCWMSGCGKEWWFEESGPEENGMNFCIKCGKPCVEIGDSNEGAGHE